MTDRITTSCQHSHTVTLDEGWRMKTGGDIEELDGYGWGLMPMRGVPPAIRAELEAALAAAEAACGGCGCAERLRAEAERRKRRADELAASEHIEASAAHEDAAFSLRWAADFLDAAQDARGSDLSAEQPATVSEQGDAKKRANWNDPNAFRALMDGPGANLPEATWSAPGDLGRMSIESMEAREATDG